MKVDSRYAPTEIEENVRSRICSDITNALQSITTIGRMFIVNDTLWYGIQNNRATPTVVNSASYITGHFTEYLKMYAGWHAPQNISDQEIDGYIELQAIKGTMIDSQSLLEIAEEIVHKKVDDPEIFSEMYRKYYIRGCFIPKESLGTYARMLRTTGKAEKLRVGLEFETGNIASSFRAFSKLNSLFRMNLIDAGVFITSKDKATTACRIWPTSNRNGSFQELENRDYRRNIALPMFEFAFSPDGFDKDAPYLGSDGNTYHPVDIGEMKYIGGKTYHLFKGERDREILLRKSHFNPLEQGD